MFKIGDVVALKREFAHNYGAVHPGRDYTVLKVSPNGRFQVDNGNDFADYIPERFSLVRPAIVPAEGVIKLRVIEAYRPARLRLGDIVTVAKEHATTYLLVEHPGKLFKKVRFEVVQQAVPAPVPNIPARRVKIGDKIKVANVYRATGPHGGDRKGNPWGYTDKLLSLNQVVTVMSAEPADYGGYKGTKIRVDKVGYNYYSYPLDAFVFEDGSLIVGGFVPAAKAPRPVGENVKAGEKVVIVSIPEVFADKYHQRHKVKDSCIGKVFEIKYDYTTAHKDGRYAYVSGMAAHAGQDTIAFPIKCLVYADEGSAITNAKPVPPPKKVLPNIFDEIAKAPTGSLCQYIYLKKGADEYIEDFSAPCYASLGRTGGPVERLVIGMAKPYARLPERSHEAYNRWLEYVVEQSPFRSAFITKTADEAKKGLEMDCSKSVDEIICSATAMRDGYEHNERLIPFTHFLDEGYSGHTAYLLAFMLNYNAGKWSVSGMSDGHSNMAGVQNMAEIIKFFKQGYHRPELKTKKPFNVGGGAYGYWVSDCITKNYHGNAVKGECMRDFLIRASEAKVVGVGWNQAVTITEDNVKKLADTLEQLINE
jgi:hypothetical protein